MPSSLSDKLRAALVDIRDNIASVAEFTKEREDCGFDKKTFYAVTRALEIISEASRKIPDEVKARYSHIDWRSIRDAGNFYRHSYDRVEVAFVQSTVERDLPVLAEMVENELAANYETPSGDPGQS